MTSRSDEPLALDERRGLSVRSRQSSNRALGDGNGGRLLTLSAVAGWISDRQPSDDGYARAAMSA